MSPSQYLSVVAAVLAGSALLHGQGPVQFRSAAKRTISPNFTYAALGGLHGGDFDGDGDVDLWVTIGSVQGGPGQDRLHRNDGRGVFEDASLQMLGTEAGASTGGAFADFDNDGDLDFLQLDALQDRLWRNDGSGGFVDVTSTNLTVEAEHGVHVDIGDVDGDGDVDAVVVNLTSTLLYRNDGPAGLTILAASLPTLASGRIELADLDRDGRAEVLLVDPNSTPGVRCFEFVGTGFVDRTSVRFAQPIQQAWDIEVFDADLDNWPDLVSVARGVVSNQFHRNDGTGRLLLATDAGFAATRHERVEAADVDGDEDVDLVLHVSPGSADALEIARNDGNGVFTLDPPNTWPAVIGDMLLHDYVVLDLDEDRDADIAVVGTAPRRTRTGPPGSGQQIVEHWYENDGTGSFRRTDEDLLPTGLAYATFGDYDGDGDLDVLQYGAGMRLLRNDGKRRFVDVTATTVPQLGSFHQARFVDVNSDGIADLLLTSGDAFGALSVRLLVGSGGALVDQTAQRLPPIPARAYGCDVGDVDGDGDVDAVVGNMNGSSVLLRNDGSGIFSATALGNSPNSGGARRAVQLTDLDGDGDLDLASLADTAVELFENSGAGVFALRATLAGGTPSQRRTMEIGDLDGNGRPDVFVGFWSADSVFHYGTGAWTWGAPVALGGSVGARAWDSAMFDCDGDGDLDLVVNGGTGTNLVVNDGSGGMSDASSRLEDGLWTLGGLAVGDLDRDGDVDIAVTGDLLDRIYWNHQVHTDLPDPAQPGARYRVEISHRPGALQQPVPALLAFASAELEIPLPGVGVLGLDLATLAFSNVYVVPAPAGIVQVDLQIPNLPSLRGLELFAQSLVWDPLAPAGGLTLSNSDVDEVR